MIVAPARRALARAAVALLLLGAPGCQLGQPMSPRPPAADPLSPDEHVRLGATYEREGRLDLAVRSYEAALRRDRQHTGALVGLGNVAAARRDLGEAERRYRNALAVAPAHADALNNLAWIYLQRGERYAEAAALAGRALEAAPGRAPYYGDTLGIALTRAGRPAEGLRALERALAATPGSDTRLRAEVLGHMAETYRALGREPEARAAEAEASRLR